MISALLLSLALAGARADSVPVASAASDDPAVQLWISDDRRLAPGDRAKVQVRTRDDGYLLVLHVDTDGHLRVLFPLDPKDDDFVRGGRKYEIRGRGGRESFTADSRTGQGTVYAAVSSDPFKFDGFVQGDHWDYRALAPQRLSAQPESDLNDLVRRMSQDDFDYDILTYDVLDRVAYSDYYSTPYYSGYYGSCFSCGYPYRSGVSIGIFFGRPYHRTYYDPFYPAYDPFYDPFFYDPYYYPAYYTPFYYPRVYYPYYAFPYTRYLGYYNNPGRGYYGPYTPYRFRGYDVVTAGYRGRGFSDARSVNTVYLPPRSRVIQPGTVNPARRLTAEPRNVPQPVAAPSARRDGRRVESAPAARGDASATAGGERRSPQGHDAEARRSGESGGRRNASPNSRQESWPQDVSPRRNDTPVDVTSRRADITPSDVTQRDPTPREVMPRRANVDRPQIERAPVTSYREPQLEQRPSRSDEPSRAAPPPSERRSDGSDGGRSGAQGGGGGDRGGGGRSQAPAARSSGGSGGSWGGSGGGGGGGQAPSSGGGRRR
jgi:hypothetical protein